MNNFVRALKEGKRHWAVLAGALLCSFAVAALWGANIAALYPIIETTLNGESLQTWNQKRLDDGLAMVAANQPLAEQKQAEITATADESAKHELELQLQVLNAKVGIGRAQTRFHQRLQPWLDRFLPKNPFPTVLLIVAIVAGATCLKQFLMVGNTMMAAYVSQSIARDVRGRVFDKAISLDRPMFDSQGISGFTAHITHTTDMLATGLSNVYGGAITEPLRIISCLFFACMFSWRLTLASLVFAPVAAFLILHVNRQIRGLSLKVLARSMSFHHVMLEVFNSLQTVHANTMEDFERGRFRDSTKQIKRIALKATFYNALTSPVTEFLGIGMLCMGVVVSGYLVIFKETHIFGIPMSDRPLNMPQLTVFFATLIGAADPLRKLSSVLTGINNGMAAANLLYPMLDIQPRVAEATNPVRLPSPHRKIEFRDITFSYDFVHPVLQGVNLTIEHGERLAIVGPNGGGKSTLINMLCRFYDPQQGAVYIDGVAIRDVALRELRSRIALVTQQTELFNESILHNIRYGRWDATEEEVIAAAKLARAHEFISGFPNGYQTIVGPNGQRISGGQRQRIALARAFLRNAEILIMDEATSQIDVDSEKLIHDALAEFGQHRTLLMITHRESTLALATRIVRVEWGKLEAVSSVATMAAA